MERDDPNTLPCTIEELRTCLLDEQLSLPEIAARFGISISRVRSALKRAGLALPRRRASQPEQALARYYRAYQKSAVKRSHAFALTLEHFAALVSQPCSYCGGAPGRKVGAWFFSGIDRIDSQQGYIPGNVRPCCGICNVAKGRMDEKDFIAWVLRAASHLQEQRNGAAERGEGLQ